MKRTNLTSLQGNMTKGFQKLEFYNIGKPTALKSQIGRDKIKTGSLELRHLGKIRLSLAFTHPMLRPLNA